MSTPKTRYLKLVLGGSYTTFKVGKKSIPLYPFESMVIKLHKEDVKRPELNEYRIGVQNTFTGNWMVFSDGRRYIPARESQVQSLIKSRFTRVGKFIQPTIII